MIATRKVNDRLLVYHRDLKFKLVTAGRDGAILSA
jgi:hypothetical protein